MIYKQVLQAIAETEGLCVNKVVIGGSSHVKLYVTNSRGESKLIVASRTPSDHRALKNIRAEFRRFARRFPADTAVVR